MNIAAKIRIANSEDAEAVSKLILTTLRTSNAGNYSWEAITHAATKFPPAAVRAILEKPGALVAIVDEKIVGTARLDGNIVRMVFVAPDKQRRGIGRQLMAQIEMDAHSNDLKQLTVPSSVTAEAFFKTLGFHAVRHAYSANGRTIVMTRAVVSP